MRNWRHTSVAKQSTIFYIRPCPRLSLPPIFFPSFVVTDQGFAINWLKDALVYCKPFCTGAEVRGRRVCVELGSAGVIARNFLFLALSLSIPGFAISPIKIVSPSIVITSSFVLFESTSAASDDSAVAAMLLDVG